MSDLVKIENTDISLSSGGIGIDFNSKLFKPKATTLVINQGMTQAEGAIPGKLRVVETGEQFTSLDVVMLVMPKQWRDFYMGDRTDGKLYRTPENLVCFSRDMHAPDARSKMPQAMRCEGCSHSNWSDGKPPVCDPYYFITLLDTTTQLPLKMYVRGTSIKPFEAGMQNFIRNYQLLKGKGMNPNIFDIKFTLTTEKSKTKSGNSIHLLKIDGKSFKMITESERDAFGPIYLDYVNYQSSKPDDTPEAVIESKVKDIEAEVGGDIEI